MTASESTTANSEEKKQQQPAAEKQQAQEQKPAAEAGTQNQEELDRGSEEQSPEEAEASLNAGFAKVQKSKGPTSQEPGSEDEEKGKKPESKQEPEKPGAAAAAEKNQQQKPAGDDQIDVEMVRGLSKRMRRVEGFQGEIKSKLDTLTDEIRKAAKSGDGDADQVGAQAEKTLKYIKEIEESVGEFKELGPIKKELEDLRNSLATLKDTGKSASEQQEIVNQGSVDIAAITQEVTLNVRHPDWREVSATPEFRSFMLSGGGPTNEQYTEYARKLRSNNPADIKAAEEMEADWQDDHPTWWKEKGQYLFSDSADDSIKMLDKFKELKNSQQQQQQQQSRKTDRLKRNLTPDGVEGDPVTEPSEEEALNRGFNRVAKQRSSGLLRN